MEIPPRPLLDEALPVWDVRERHERLVPAPADDVWQALVTVTVGELPVTRGLMRIRSLGRYPLGRGRRTVLDMLPPGEVARREPTELLLGLVSPTSGRSPVSAAAELRPATIEELCRTLPDGWVRIGMDFRLEPAAGGTRLSTETRVLATGPAAKRVFGAYWRVIRGGSGLIRRELLAAVARRAGAAGG